MVSWGSLWNSTFEARSHRKKTGFVSDPWVAGTFPPASEGSLPVRRWRKVQSVQLQASNKKDGGEKWIYMGVSLNGGTPETPQNDHFQ